MGYLLAVLFILVGSAAGIYGLTEKDATALIMIAFCALGVWVSVAKARQTPNRQVAYFPYED